MNISNLYLRYLPQQQSQLGMIKINNNAVMHNLDNIKIVAHKPLWA